jgi:hypothetical protein
LRKNIDIVIAVVIIVGVDVALFHFGVYTPWLKPDSYSGHVEQTSRRLAAFRKTAPDRKIILMGNSSVGAGLQEEEIERGLEASGHNLGVFNMAQGGSTPRAWYFLFKHEKFQEDECPVVVLGLMLSSLAKDDAEGPDLSIIKSRIAISDTPALPSMFDDTESRLRVGFLGLYKTPLFQEDLVDFIASPRGRRAHVEENRESERKFEEGYRRTNNSSRDLTSARLGADDRLLEDELAPFIKQDPQFKGQLTRALIRQRDGSDSLEVDYGFSPIRIDFLVRVVNLLNARDATVVLAVMPASPFPADPQRGHAEITGVFNEIRKSGADVELFLDEPLLQSLQQPEFFRDALHLNREGALLLSARLTDFLDRVLVAESP